MYQPPGCAVLLIVHVGDHGSSSMMGRAYPRFLLGMDLRLITKEVYTILLDMTVNCEASADKHVLRRPSSPASSA